MHTKVFSTNMLHPKFMVRQIGITDGAMMELTEGSRDVEQLTAELAKLLHRHVSGDWGEVDSEDWATNDRAVKSGARILSAYHLYGVKLWIISDAAWTDEPRLREVTTILRPADY